MSEICNTCAGTGKKLYDNDSQEWGRCHACAGLGYITTEEDHKAFLREMIAKMPKEIWARQPDRAQLHMDGSSPVSARTKHFPGSIKYVLYEGNENGQ